MTLGDGDDRLFEVGPPAPRSTAERVSTPRNPLVEAREFYGWTLDKLEVLSAYLRMYVRVAGGGTYIDAFAGGGHASIDGQGVPGSPLRAAESTCFKSLHLFEMGRNEHQRLTSAIAALPDATRAKVCVHPRGDANELVPKLLESGQVPKDKPCFAFLDPNSTELDWQTVASLARYKQYVPSPTDKRKPLECKTELWILVNTHQALGRLMPADRVKHRVPPHAGVLDRVMGGREAWWDIWGAHFGSGPVMPGLRYADRLISEFGYRWSNAQLVRDPKTKRPVYFMVHASDHPAAHSFMRSAKRDRWEMPQLPGTFTVKANN